MTTTTPSAPAAHAFDPAQWLRDFETAGGGYCTTDSNVILGVILAGHCADQQAQARRMIDRLRPDQTESLSAHLRLRESRRESEPDTAIISAFERRKATFARYNALPVDDATYDPHDSMTDAERECWSIIDAADGVIGRSIAATPQGIAAQLWTCLSHSLTEREEHAAAVNADMAALEAVEQGLDRTDKLILAAIKGLREMEGR
jgi:plasmid stabilization system protein ParE